jgi:pyrroline-5-carboxylate reductase
MTMDMSGERIGFLGGGYLASAIAAGLIKEKVVEPGSILVSDPRAERHDHFRDRFGIEASSGNVELATRSTILFLTVKPQIARTVLDEISPSLAMETLIISPCAGILTSNIEQALGGMHPVLRIMPNIAAQVARAATALCRGTHVSEEHVEKALTLCRVFGTVEEIDESLMDAVTGLSGSGPAYIFLIIDALADAGVKVGLRRDQARRLVAQTVLGSARMLLDTGEHPSELKDMVTSPGGTAITGLAALEEGGLRTTLISAVEQATRRSAELGSLLNDK